MSNTTPLTGALGSIIGYLGADSCEPNIFERLLWPERFYNNITLGSLLKITIAAPSGGPLHRAALHTLDVFRNKGLQGGMQQGHMLGTAFFADTGLRYQAHGKALEDEDREARNGIWCTVLRMASRMQVKLRENTVQENAKADLEANSQQQRPVRRTTQMVQHLKLSCLSVTEATARQLPIVTEDGHFISIIPAIIISELGALAAASVIAGAYQQHWFGAYMLVPLLLKLVAVPTSVRRGVSHSNKKVAVSAAKDGNVLFQLHDYDYGCHFISGSPEVVRSFFRHVGHPLRETRWDGLREILGIGMVVVLVLYFPVALLSTLWLSAPAQAVWLAYQIWTVILMYVARFADLHSAGRIEESLARFLVSDGKVVLETKEMGLVLAELTSVRVASIGQGQARARKIVEEHHTFLKEQSK